MKEIEVENSAHKFASYLDRIKLRIIELSNEFGYLAPSLVLVDAVLSINRPYTKLVVPRVKIFQENNINSLTQLNDLINERGEVGICEYWCYNHRERVGILSRLTNKYLSWESGNNLPDSIGSLKLWGINSKMEDFDNFNVRGIGFTTFQYLRLLTGANTTKPDVHLKRAIFDGLGKNVGEKGIVRITERTSEILNVPTRKLDYSIWHYYSNKKVTL